MQPFHYREKDLYCEGVSVGDVAREVGTPLYLYSRQALESSFDALDSAFGAVPHLTCYSVKSNSNLAVLQVLGRRGAGVDVVSGGEIYRARLAGIPGNRIVYSGVGKSPDDIKMALEAGILMFNVESLQELDELDRIAGECSVQAPTALRINPDVDPQTHPYISTGLQENKFGIGMDDALEAYRLADAKQHIRIVGVDCHIGSQITQITPFADALDRIRLFIEKLQGLGITVRYVDIGGGLGITYRDETPPPPADYAGAVMQALGGLDCTLILEPGRSIAGNAGILVTAVLYTKKTGCKNFIIVDAAMNDLVRPSLYNAYHDIWPVENVPREELSADIVGPICESGDFIVRDRPVPAFEREDVIAVMSSGAYGFTMSSNYNSRPRVPEVIADGDQYFVVRKRESFDDLVRLEGVPEEFFR